MSCNTKKHCIVWDLNLYLTGKKISPRDSGTFLFVLVILTTPRKWLKLGKFGFDQARYGLD